MLYRLEVEIENNWIGDDSLSAGYFKSYSAADRAFRTYLRCREEFIKLDKKDQNRFLLSWYPTLKGSNSRLQRATRSLSTSTAIRIVKYELGTLDKSEVFSV